MNKVKKIPGFIYGMAMKVHADGKVSTAVTNSGNYVKLSDAVRTVYSKEIEF